MTLRIPTIATLILLLSACGGGGGGGPTVSHQPAPQPQPGPAPDIAFPYPDSGRYRVAGLPPITGPDVRHMPVYRDDERILVGVDQGSEHLGDLPEAGERGGFTVRHGRLDDGVGLAALRDYLDHVTDDPAIRWNSAPVVYFFADADTEDIDRGLRAIQAVNAALPADLKMTVHPTPVLQRGTDGIYIDFNRAVGDDTLGHADTTYRTDPPDIAASYIAMGNDYADPGDRIGVNTLIHELMHAMGMIGGTGGSHVPDDVASLMQDTQAFHGDQPLSLLYRIDREALQAIYSGRGDGLSPSSFGPWESASMNVAGVGEHAAFGVRFANGYAEPWAYGLDPRTNLVDNRALSGRAKWEGALVGLTPSAASVLGDADIYVFLDSSIGQVLGKRAMEGSAQFTNLESFPAGTTPGAKGTGTQWGDGDLNYQIGIVGNTLFDGPGGDEGRIAGIFVGRNHEGVAGTLQRDDLTAAFGGTR